MSEKSGQTSTGMGKGNATSNAGNNKRAVVHTKMYGLGLKGGGRRKTQRKKRKRRGSNFNSNNNY